MLQLQLVRFFDDCFTSARRFGPFRHCSGIDNFHDQLSLWRFTQVLLLKVDCPSTRANRISSCETAVPIPVAPGGIPVLHD